jgi:hypothetical protein
MTPAQATLQLDAMQKLLADPYTKQFLTSLSQGSGSAQGRESMIVLVHSLTPSLLAAPNGAEALKAIKTLLDQLVFNSSNVPQSFKTEVQAVYDQTKAMLGDATGIFPPLQKILACAGSAEIRCKDPSPATCTSKDDELVGALYDILSRPEGSGPGQGGVDLATLVGALKTLATIDSTGQTGRTLRMVVQGIEGAPDESEPHEMRDAVAALSKQALTEEEGKKLVPALSVLIEKNIVSELFSFVQDILYACPKKP